MLKQAISTIRCHPELVEGLFQIVHKAVRQAKRAKLVIKQL